MEITAVEDDNEELLNNFTPTRVKKESIDNVDLAQYCGVFLLQSYKAAISPPILSQLPAKFIWNQTETFKTLHWHGTLPYQPKYELSSPSSPAI